MTLINTIASNDDIATSSVGNPSRRLLLLHSALLSLGVGACGGNPIRKELYVSTIAGSGASGSSDVAAGLALNATFKGPRGIVVASNGDIYLSDIDTVFSESRLRKVAVDGSVSTVAGDGDGYVDAAAGLSTNARFNRPEGLAIDSVGNIYVADTQNHRIRKLATDGSVSLVAGSGTAGFADVGAAAATTAQFNSPVALCLDTAGNVYVADKANHRIRKIATDGSVTTVAGTGAAGFNDGAGAGAQFDAPSGLAIDSTGVLYVADSGNRRIRKIATNGTVSTYAGNGSSGVVNTGAGQSGNAQFISPLRVLVDKDGSIIVADDSAFNLRKIAVDGTVTTFAGTGASGYLDGPAATAQFGDIYGIAVDASNAVFIADTGQRRVRKAAMRNA